MKFFHRMNRRTDMDILWPACKEHAESLDHAKAAFFMHITNDTSWTDYYTNEELIAFVNDLTA
jgi:hypothetical protein